jgi:hypothetical protein
MQFKKKSINNLKKDQGQFMLLFKTHNPSHELVINPIKSKPKK